MLGGNSLKKFIENIRKADISKQYRQSLLLEQDYELISLFSAMENHNVADIECSKRRLLEISVELKGLDLHERLP